MFLNQLRTAVDAAATLGDVAALEGPKTRPCGRI
jgi:hypothetical protein